MKGIMKKNQFAILIIALMLVTAGYLNYTANNNIENYVSTSANLNENKEIGDAEFVSSNKTEKLTNTIENEIVSNDTMYQDFTNTTEENSIITSAQTTNVKDNYFTSSKLQRDTMYSQMIESYQKILESSVISTEQKAIATEEINNINNTKNAIMICENLIQTKGFSECIIFVNDKSISIIVKAEELSNDKIAQIQNIVSRELKAEIENIHISNK